MVFFLDNVAKMWNCIVISCIYNYTDPQPSEKQNFFSKKYNITTDSPAPPLFIIRKDENIEDSFRIIIDDSGRVYKSWKCYLRENKLHEWEIIFPLN